MFGSVRGLRARGPSPGARISVFSQPRGALALSYNGRRVEPQSGWGGAAQSWTNGWGPGAPQSRRAPQGYDAASEAQQAEYAAQQQGSAVAASSSSQADYLAALRAEAYAGGSQGMSAAQSALQAPAGASGAGSSGQGYDQGYDDQGYDPRYDDQGYEDGYDPRYADQGDYYDHRLAQRRAGERAYDTRYTQPRQGGEAYDQGYGQGYEQGQGAAEESAAGPQASAPTPQSAEFSSLSLPDKLAAWRQEAYSGASGAGAPAAAESAPEQGAQDDGLNTSPLFQARA